ncbi:16S rRNA (cytidine(1402)-2'-O)-methyltransferase [Phaeobacter gallaeciensis]|uniref:Ribosomal RNA small subunit methyltransferase I n=1 Tax=Phaeobacter gallaeciensis TaxID=60890 RepID=A0AAC9Z6Z9_9RHOB|nr:16S rRNA (cytidine(1402)-2'-O)-methyltransferase [Phaeobacter gallaeciensis]AHD08539.1 putative S-adenosylmethionine-dependent methyltransferase, YraL family [Phaeobacter gallaeciensis DSM 26640]ATE91805.1 putative S-adenosylmethionine-dependent methyltransferase, YraL family [Phaeobacter gallaeciensis]ATE98371.1 putative S-adenosylmethionine-dependent methyltransferase, YraL family [Phaeobacter gallaeciensis]ATF00421.1 putative S-adenosylmethionine-dependent methyltransferase, YraL family [
MNHKIVHLPSGLYFVATPIGTARDITLRALDVLASADMIAAEDTRSLRKLMEIHGVPLNGRQIVAYHDHSGAGDRARLLSALEEGQSVAYASEAGMPLIADPGYDLSRAAAEAGHLVTVAPGASAALAALTLAGLPTDAFFFAGFLPNASGARRKRLEELIAVPGTLVFYESPKRIAASLRDMAAVLGDRPAALCREITKKFEEVRRDSLLTLAEGLDQAPVKGEIVVLVDRARGTSVSDGDLDSDLRAALKDNSVKDAASIVAEMHNLPRRKIYQLALDMAKDAG